MNNYQDSDNYNDNKQEDKGWKELGVIYLILIIDGFLIYYIFKLWDTHLFLATLLALLMVVISIFGQGLLVVWFPNFMKERAQRKAEKRTVTCRSVKCPYCDSYDVKKISNISKAVSYSIFGVYSLSRNSKQWHCYECDSDF